MKKILAAGVVLVLVVGVCAYALLRDRSPEVPAGAVTPNGIITLTGHAGGTLDPTGLTLSLLDEYGGISVGQAEVIDGGYFRFSPVRPGTYTLVATDGSVEAQQVTVARDADPLLVRTCGDCRGKESTEHTGMHSPKNNPVPAPDKPAPTKPAADNPAAATTVKITSPADGGLKYDKSEYMAAAGAVTLQYTNPSPVPHNVAIDVAGKATEGKIIQGGASDAITVDLPAGRYEIYCAVPGHRQAGMVATLVVT